MAPDQARDRTDTGTQPLSAGPRTAVGPPVAPPSGTPAGPSGPAPSRGGLSTTQRGIVLVACALVGIAVGVGAQQLVGQGGSAPAAAPTPSTSAAPTPVRVDVSSFSVNGSGFRQEDGAWMSEGYNSEKFGNLKPGIGLLLDLGSARPLRAVTFEALNGPLTVELRAADTKAAALDGYRPVGSAVSAKGRTTLPASAGGSHRYWLVWVTQLATSSEGRYRAQLGSVAAQG